MKHIEVTVYAYEYDILMMLQDRYNIKDTSINTERTDAYGWVHNASGELVKEKLLSFDGDTTITFNFEKDFHVGIKRYIIWSAFKNNVPTNEVVKTISNIIDESIEKWLYDLKYSIKKV